MTRYCPRSHRGRSFTGRIASASPDAPEPKVRIQLPPGQSQRVALVTGGGTAVGRDGTVEMWAADAQFLIPAGWTKLAEWTTDEDAAAKRSKPQPVQTVPQLGSMEWFEAQKKKG